MPHADPRHVRLLVVDVDGVLTDGAIVLDATGGELKTFHVRDGMAMAAWRQMGLGLAVVSGRACPAVDRRMRELGIAHVMQGVTDKARAVVALMEQLQVQATATAYLGDDWPDLPAMRQVGYPMAVADAAAEVRAAAAFVTSCPGGRGAVREAIEHLLRARDLLSAAVELYH